MSVVNALRTGSELRVHSGPAGSIHIHRTAWVVVFALVVGIPSASVATTYKRPDDFLIVCLDYDSGRIVWQGEVKGIRSPALQVREGVLIASGSIPRSRGTGTSIDFAFDSATGKPTTARTMEPVQARRLMLAPNLTDSRGRTLDFDPENTNSLRYTRDGKTKVLKELEGYPSDLQVLGDLAIFSFNDFGLPSEAYAWDLSRNVLAWEFTPWREDLRAATEQYTGVTVIGHTIYVAWHQNLTALDLAGRALWTTHLPRQKLRPFDAAWTQVFRHQNRLFAVVYDWLFSIDPVSGAVLWFYDGGPLNDTTPLIFRDRVYLTSRQNRSVEILSHTFVTSENEPTPLIRVTRKGHRYLVDEVPRGEVAKTARIYWSLKPLSAKKKDGPVFRLAGVDHELGDLADGRAVYFKQSELSDPGRVIQR